jgi:uncharacterized protein YabN with tetrapyrrole methylase and pyrophosphatase domain
LKSFLAQIAIDPDALAQFLLDPESGMATAGFADEDRGFQEESESPETAEEPSTGSLIVVGTGIRSTGQMTMEAIAHIKLAEKVFYLVADPVGEEIINQLNPRGAVSLATLYEQGKARRETYREMVDQILDSVRSGRRTCAVFYGHPGVFVAPSHDAIQKARSEGFNARMLPGVSAEDCLFADLGFDPATAGCQSYESTDFLVNDRRIDPSSHVVLWQVGVLGDQTFNLEVQQTNPLNLLVERLLKIYPADHKACVYEAAVNPGDEPKVDWLTLESLNASKLSIISTLYLPPAEPPRFDAGLYFALTWPGHAPRS